MKHRNSMFHKLSAQPEKLRKDPDPYIIDFHLTLSQKWWYDTYLRMC